jgi:hypothetical protein
MKIIINNQIIECTDLFIQETIIKVNNQIYKFDNLKFHDLNLDLPKVIGTVTKNMFSDIVFHISDNLDGISIQYSVSEGSTSDPMIKIGTNILQIDHDHILTIFIAHELGHILYSQDELSFELTKIKYLKTISSIICIIIGFLTTRFHNKIIELPVLLLSTFGLSLIIKFIDKILIKKNNFNSEFFADEYAVKLTKKPKDTIQALELIQSLVGDVQDSLTHPKLSARILNIKQKFWLRILIQDSISFVKNLFR